MFNSIYAIKHLRNEALIIRPKGKPMPVKKIEPKPKKTKPVYTTPSVSKTRHIIIPGPKDLNIPSDELNNYCIMLYGGKGAGKTTASSTFPDHFNFQFEPARRNVKMRMYPLLVRRAAEITCDEDDPWVEFILACEQVREDKTITWVAIDSVDLAYKCCQEHVCRLNECESPTDKNDYGKTWAAVTDTFVSTMNSLRIAGKSLLFISHAKERETEFFDSDGMKENLSLITPTCTASCLKVMKQMCDFWLYLGKSAGEQRTLTVRDTNDPRMLDVACGCGFIDEDGNPINRINLPSDQSQFYKVVNDAFQGRVPRAKVAPKKVVRKVNK